MLTESTLNPPELRAAIRRAYALGQARARAELYTRWRGVLRDATRAAAIILPLAWVAGRVLAGMGA